MIADGRWAEYPSPQEDDISGERDKTWPEEETGHRGWQQLLQFGGRGRWRRWAGSREREGPPPPADSSECCSQPSIFLLPLLHHVFLCASPTTCHPRWQSQAACSARRQWWCRYVWMLSSGKHSFVQIIELNPTLILLKGRIIVGNKDNLPNFNWSRTRLLTNKLRDLLMKGTHKHTEH